jgi:anti-anti-sigma factor
MDPTVIVFSGEYDLARKEPLRKELETLNPQPNVILDFTEVAYLDSICVTELLRMHGLRAANGFETETVVVRNPSVRRLFDILGLNQVFRVVETIDAA